MMALSDGEKNLMMLSAVLTQITCVTDRRTDGIGVAYTRYSIYAVARKKIKRDRRKNVAMTSIFGLK